MMTNHRGILVGLIFCLVLVCLVVGQASVSADGLTIKVDPRYVDERTREHLEEMQLRDAQRDARQMETNRQRAQESREQPVQHGNVAPQPEAQDPRCQELLSLISKTAPTEKSSFGEIYSLKARRKALTEEYELKCMTAGGRQQRSQNRNDEKIERKLNIIDFRQRELDRKIGGY